MTFIAYIGPGFAAGALEALVAIVVGLLFLLLGCVYYPLKIMFRRLTSWRKTSQA